MFDRISNGWALARQSFDVLRLDKEMLVFPLLSGISCIFVLASFALPMWFTDAIQVLADDGKLPNNPLAYVVVFAFYFVNYFVIVFFNAALVACAVIRFSGGDPTVSDGLNAAASRLPQILAWSFVSATVGLILKAIESRSEKLGQFAVALVGMAWGAATYFVVPVLVVEKLGPIDAVKRSTAILRKAWGESLAANFGIGFFVFLACLAALVPAILGILSGQPALLAIGITITVLMWIIISLVSSALSAILLGAIYLYASEGRAPKQFDESLLSHAFERK